MNEVAENPPWSISFEYFDRLIFQNNYDCLPLTFGTSIVDDFSLEGSAVVASIFSYHQKEEQSKNNQIM